MSASVRVTLAELVALRARATQLGKAEHRRSADRMSGPHASPFRGRGMEYAESRPYAAGDDVRHIDWRVTARTGRTHTKLFQPERERITAVVLDGSPAMAFGTRACLKSVQAARVAALLVWAAAAQGDRLAAALGHPLPEIVAPQGARRGALRVLDALVRWQPLAGIGPHDASHRLSSALESLQRTLRPGSHVLLLLDPRSVDAAVERVLVRLRGHHDLIACLMVDPIELAPPPPADYAISDGHARRRLGLRDAPTRAAWSAHFSAQRDGAIERLQRAGVRVRVTSTTDDPVQVLRDLLAGRVARRVA